MLLLLDGENERFRPLVGGVCMSRHLYSDVARRKLSVIPQFATYQLCMVPAERSRLSFVSTVKLFAWCLRVRLLVLHALCKLILRCASSTGKHASSDQKGHTSRNI